MKKTEADEVEIERVPRHAAAAALRKDRSLRPGPSMMEAAVDGQPEAVAIRDAWAFRFPVTTMSATEYDAMVSRSEGVVFGA